VGLTGIVSSAISVSLSAMTYWAFTIQGIGSRLSTVGPILMLVGVAGIVMSARVFIMSRSSENHHDTLDRQVFDRSSGCRSVHQGIEELTLRVLSSATTRPERHKLPARGTSVRRTVAAPNTLQSAHGSSQVGLRNKRLVAL
jgi:hypothetical protein